MSRYTCGACGVETDDAGNHESFCPGSPDDRIEALERQVAELHNNVIELVATVARLLEAQR